MKGPGIKPKVALVGQDGNALFILGRVVSHLRIAGADEEYVTQYKKEATSGDFDNLLQITMRYVDVC